MLAALARRNLCFSFSLLLIPVEVLGVLPLLPLPVLPALRGVQGSISSWSPLWEHRLCPGTWLFLVVVELFVASPCRLPLVDESQVQGGSGIIFCVLSLVLS